MKNIIISLFCTFSIVSFCQDSGELEVENTIVDFFEAFHQRDSARLKSMVTKDILMQTISTSENGETVLGTTDFEKFTASIASITEQTSFEEKLTGFSIQIDGEMANAWTPYEFWYNGSFSHCGVNSFQLIKQNGTWKIFFLVDTRRRKGCDKP